MSAMRALDTNVAVQLMMRDRPEDHRRAVKAVGKRPLFIPVTVVFEIEWMLKIVHKRERATRLQLMEKFFGLPEVQVQNAEAVAAALALFAEGLEFPDALHLALSSEASSFVTFDEPLARRARAAGGSVPVTLA